MARRFIAIALALLGAAGAYLILHQEAPRMANSQRERIMRIKLNGPDIADGAGLRSTIKSRRSIRSYSAAPITMGELSLLLWSAQGVTGEYMGHALRAAPSAGALYPLEIYVVATAVVEMESGAYRYLPHEHALEPVRTGRINQELASAALGQGSVRDGAASIIISSVYARTIRKYGERGIRYADMEAGAAAENVYLMATSLGLGTVLVGAFDDKQVRTLLKMAEGEHPLAIMPIGRAGGH